MRKNTCVDHHRLTPIYCHVCMYTLKRISTDVQYIVIIYYIYNRWIRYEHWAVNNNISKPDTIKCLKRKGRARCHIFEDTINILTCWTTKTTSSTVLKGFYLDLSYFKTCNVKYCQWIINKNDATQTNSKRLKSHMTDINVLA